MDTLIDIDKQLMLWLNTDAFPFLDGPMWYFSSKFFWTPIYALMLYALFKKYNTKYFVWIVVIIALCVLINDQTASGLFKNWIARSRPSHDPDISSQLHLVTEPNGNIYKGGKFGFYSSHAANMAGVVTLFILMMKPMRRLLSVLLILWVLLISYSRIYLGVHFPFDVLMGLFMGTLVGFLSFVLWKKSMQKLYPNEAIFNSRPASL